MSEAEVARQVEELRHTLQCAHARVIDEMELHLVGYEQAACEALEERLARAIREESAESPAPND